MKQIPNYIKKVLSKSVLDWSLDEIEIIVKYQQDNNLYPKVPTEPREPQELPCFWEQRGVTSSC